MWYLGVYVGAAALAAWVFCRAAARGNAPVPAPVTLTFVGGERDGTTIPDLHEGVITHYQWGPDRYVRVGDRLVLEGGALLSGYRLREYSGTLRRAGARGREGA